jgi:tetratricopeptide (TPR) repeat protein
MKAEHRKELQTNALADAVGKLIKGARSRPNATTVTFWVFLILAVGLFFGWRWWSSHSERTRSALWLRLDEAANLEAVAAVARDGQGTPPGRMARYQQARVLLRQGLSELCSYSATREEREKNPPPLDKLEQARDLYNQLHKDARDNPLLAQEALMGAAKAEEALGDFDAAREKYQALANDFPDSFLGKQAAVRARLLEDPAELERLKEFQRQLEPHVSKG